MDAVLEPLEHPSLIPSLSTGKSVAVDNFIHKVAKAV
jgi:hypothetical protein